ncbi:hypothetical protein EDB85DRAFT_2283172 [Lactarius pseudohatsudake]|nr:hypothetical protein EDB85DRAFT_2283172 [Lactarius pseudohatsudake]
MTTRHRHHCRPRRRHRRSCLRAVPAAASLSFLPLCCSRRRVTVVVGVVAVGVARRVAVALRRLLRAVRGGGGGGLVPGDGLEAAATGCVLESGGGSGHGDLGAEAQQRRLLRAVRGGGSGELVRGDGLEAAATGLCAGKWRRRRPRGLRGRSPAAAGGVGAKGQGMVVWWIACPRCCPWSRGGGRCAKQFSCSVRSETLKLEA